MRRRPTRSARATETVEHVVREIGDTRRVVVTGGANGSPLSEEYYLAIMKSVANEPVDALHTGAMQSAKGLVTRTRTPVESSACKKEALWARQAVTEAGKPGMAVLGIMSGATSESQDAAHFEGALRQSDTHLVVFQNEVKFTYDLLNKMLHDQSVGATVRRAAARSRWVLGRRRDDGHHWHRGGHPRLRDVSPRQLQLVPPEPVHGVHHQPGGYLNSRA